MEFAYNVYRNLCLFSALLFILLDDYYAGEKFPTKYLDLEEELPTSSDLTRYLESLCKIVEFIGRQPNETESNQALSLFFAKAVLKRTLQNYAQKMDQAQIDTSKHVINVAETYLSHFTYVHKPYGWKNSLFKVSEILRDDAPQVYSIGDFNRNRLTKWITGKYNLNNFTKEFDEASLPKEKYVKLVDFLDRKSGYHITIKDSDLCIMSVAFNRVPVTMDLQPCRPNPYCMEKMHSAPSVAYSLSHRLLNMLFLRHIRRCYMVSDVEDQVHIDILCASMYRETIYLARRGYFCRDLFLEHISYCSRMGYQEFHRRRWYNKAISWMNEDGCIQENVNFNKNRTMILMAKTSDPNKRKLLRETLDSLLHEKCHSHPMSVLVSVLANAVRYAAHFMET